MKELRVASIQVKNVLGIEERALAPDGRAVMLSGRNATGKSSLISAVQAALSGGSLARLARIGSEKEPEVVLVLDGPGGHFRIEKSGSETARVRARVGDSAAFEDVPKPQAWLSKLFDFQCANPVAFLMAPDKDRALMLLEALPLEMDQARLDEITAPVSAHIGFVPEDLHPLEHLALVRERIFNARTGVNRDLKAKSEAAEVTRRNVPAVLPGDLKSEIERLEEAVAKGSTEVATEEEAAVSAARAALATARAKHGLGASKVNAAFDKLKRDLIIAHERAVAEMMRGLNAESAQARTRADAELSGLSEALRAAEVAASRTRDEALTEVERKKDLLGASRERLVALRTQAEGALKALALSEQAAQFEAEADRHRAESGLLTASLDALDGFRRGLADRLPIEGLEIEGKEVRRHGVPFEQLNTGQQVEIAAAVAQLRAANNPLKVLFLDGLQDLDSERRTALVDRLLEAGVQPFGAVVTDGDLEVAYIGAVRAEETA